jgi:hypothetical protein
MVFQEELDIIKATGDRRQATGDRRQATRRPEEFGIEKIK